MRILLSFFLSFCLIFEQAGFAQSIDLSHYFVRNSSQNIPQGDKFRPLHLRYISYDRQANDFRVLLDKGDAVGNGLKPFPTMEEETQELMKYFFIGLALPNDKFWVNLRPDSPDNILDPDLEQTDIGRIFLESDLQLKKDTSSFTSPQTPEGKAYWDKLYKKAEELFGTENITIPTITRPWIVPNEIVIREAPDNAYIYKATLKVMLEEDYLNQKTEKPKNQKTEIYNFSDPRLKELNEYSTRLIKEAIIPKLTYEVNTSKRYAQLRQVYYSLILAQWFKQKYGSLRSIRAPGTRAPVNNYIDLIDSGNLSNIASNRPYDKQDYFQQYQKSFKDGEYNLQEPVYTPTGQSIRRYMSGGIGQFNNIMGSKIPIHGAGEGSSAITRGKFLSECFKLTGAGGFIEKSEPAGIVDSSLAISEVFTYTLDYFDNWRKEISKPFNDKEKEEIKRIIGIYAERFKSAGKDSTQLRYEDILRILPSIQQLKRIDQDEGRAFLLNLCRVQYAQEGAPFTWGDIFSWKDDRPPVLFYDEIRDLLPDYHLVRVIVLGDYYKAPSLPEEFSEYFSITDALHKSHHVSQPEPVMTEFFFINGVYVGYGVTRILDKTYLEMQFKIFPETAYSGLGQEKVKGLSRKIFESRIDLLKKLIPGRVILIESSQYPTDKALAFYLKLGFVFRVFNEEGSPNYRKGLKLSLKDETVGSPVKEEHGSLLLESTKGGIAFNSLPIQTESIASSALATLPGVRAFRGDLDSEWAQIQAVFNAGIRPSAQRLADFTAAACASPLDGQRREDILKLIAELLRRDEEDKRLVSMDPTLKNLLSVLEATLWRE